MYEKAVNEYREKMMDYLDPVSKCDDDEYDYLGSSRMGNDNGKEKILTLTIEELDFSVRTFNVLNRAGIRTVEDIISLSEGEMMRVRNLDKKSFDEVVEKMQSLGFDLCDDEEY